MDKLSQIENKIIDIIRTSKRVKSSEVNKKLAQNGEEMSLVTVKRLLSSLELKKVVLVEGAGRSTSYILSNYGKLISDIDPALYCAMEPDIRVGESGYNFTLLKSINFYPFTSEEKKSLLESTDYYKTKTKDLPESIHKKELERFVIELSWKSSKIEGNTYTLLDTENLLLKNVEAPGHNKEEAIMILNHKKAFDFVYANKEEFKSLSQKNLEEVHSILVDGLNVNKGLRSKPVGILGSKYKPLDNIYQIKEALDNLIDAVNKMEDGYAKSLLVLLGLSYIQLFEDGNKRTSRIVANAVLLASGLSPLSYRSVDEKSYREAMLVFYELNSMIPFKKIFIDQYNFAARNYLLS